MNPINIVCLFILGAGVGFWLGLGYAAASRREP